MLLKYFQWFNSHYSSTDLRRQIGSKDDDVICAGNSPVTGEFPALRPVTRSFDIFFDRRLNKRLSKQSWRW